MGKGSKSRNAFFFFMQDFKNQQGRNFKSMAEVANAAGPHWQNLAPQEKRKYEDMSKHSKENPQKQTSVGESVNEIIKEQKEKEHREMTIKQEIDNIVRIGVNTKTIADQYFYLMHINEFCYWERKKRYYPAEIALGKFNLRDGIIKEDVYGCLVQPGPLPMGYSAIAKQKAEETHQIQHMSDEDNTEEVLMAIIAKLSEDDMDSFPPIYVSENNVEIAENVLRNMCNDYGHNDIFTIYSLQYLLYSLKNNISKTGAKVWPTISVSKMQLENDVYDYCSGIACAYHETAEIPVHCSRSKIVRWAYIICDNCNIDLDLPLIKGHHVPLNALSEQSLYSRPTSSASTASTRVSASWARSTASNSKGGEHQQDDAGSEIYTIADESDTSSYHGFDSDSQATNEEETWHRPRRTAKYKSPQSLSEHTDICSQLSQSSMNSEYIPGRRPLSQSSANPGVARLVNPIRGRGRGRGILQTRPQP